MADVRVSLRLPRELLDEVDALARAEDRTRSSVVRVALRDGIKRRAVARAEEQSRPDGWGA